MSKMVLNREALGEPTLKALVHRFIDPSMDAIGAHKRGHRYMRITGGMRGDLLVTSRRLQKPVVGFDVTIAITPIAYLDWAVWLAAEDGDPTYQPSMANFLWRRSLRTPPDLPSAPRWSFHDSKTFTECGEALQQAIEEQAVPILTMIDSRADLLDAFADSKFRSRGRVLTTAERARAVLLIADGPSRELTQTLEAVEAAGGADFVRWARDRLNRAPALRTT